MGKAVITVTAMNAYPPITILIPAFNLQEYIADTIESAAKQCYEGSVQIIVLDDGSSDRTLETAQRISTKYTNVVVFTQGNHGRAQTRNRLLQLATTELVGWIDGDDMASPLWIREQVTLLQSQSSLVAVSGTGYAMSSTGRPIGPIERPLRHAEIESLHLNGYSNAFFQSCTVVRRSAVLAVGGYRDEFSVSEDYDLWLRMAEIGHLANHPNRHLYYRVHATSANATLGSQQKQQGLAAVQLARARKGLPPLEGSQPVAPNLRQKSDWNRQVYWINIALKSGNPWTALTLIGPAIARCPASLLLWLMFGVGCCDTMLQFGNRTASFRPGVACKQGKLGTVSAYRLARRLVVLKRRLLNRLC